jgi:alkaline phosphatase D
MIPSPIAFRKSLLSAVSPRHSHGKIACTAKFLIRSCALLLMFSVMACTQPLFPPSAVKDLDPAMQMGIFNPEADVYFKDHLAQAGGRIISIEQTSDGFLITAEELPLTQTATMVVETANSTGSFVFLYKGRIDPLGLQQGNKFIMVGFVKGTQLVTINGVQRLAPYLLARCLHVWKTGRYAISDFPNLPGGYYPLEHQTYCLDSPPNKTTSSLTGAVSHGIATGDVSSDSALVWFRTDGPAQVEVRFTTVNDWERFVLGGAQQQSSMKTEQFFTKEEQDFTLTVPLKGLSPATRYRYEVRTIQPTQPPGSTTGTTQGEFMTAPSSNESVPTTFLWSADLGGQHRCRDEQTGYPIFDILRGQKPDFTLLLGDLIYGDDRCPSPPNAAGSDFTASTLSQYRAKHRYQHGSLALQRFLASVPIWAIWDDHDVRDNFSGPYDPQMPLGRQALLEYWPIRTAPDDPTRLYRQLRYGADLEVFILDTRQYRSRNADLDGPSKTMLGQAQLAWLLDGLAHSTAKWKLIATSVPLSTSKAGSLAKPGNDSWARGTDGTGFQTELRVIVDTILSQQIRNVVWLAADVHYVQANAYDANGDGVIDFHEFIGGPLSGASKAPLLPDRAFNPTTLFSEGGFMNFGKITVRGATLEVTMIDDSGKARFSYQLTAQ